MVDEAALVPLERIERMILFIRGEKVMLDADLAELYGVPTKALNLAVKRNIERFPADFMFQLNEEEMEALRFHFETSNAGGQAETGILRSQIGASNARSQTQPADLTSQSVTSKPGRGGRRYPPYAFTEQGVAMLSSVLRSERAVAVNIEIMRAFVRLRQLLSSNAELKRKLDELEQKYDEQFKIVFDAIRQLMLPPVEDTKRIGFRTARGRKGEG